MFRKFWRRKIRRRIFPPDNKMDNILSEYKISEKKSEIKTRDKGKE